VAVPLRFTESSVLGWYQGTSSDSDSTRPSAMGLTPAATSAK
jgi:hypothetical protein